MATPNTDKATTLMGRFIQIPPLFSSPAPILITARYVSELKARYEPAYKILANASKTKAWRSAETGLTEAERAVPSWKKHTHLYMLIGFAYAGADVDIAIKKPASSDKNRGKSCDPAAETELGLVVVVWNSIWHRNSFSYQMYLLLNMMGDGLCTPHKVNKQVVFYTRISIQPSAQTGRLAAMETGN
ncbi:uncharacterized protein PG998_006138 [Apiospora kogelbergensis]|uniref:Uncharacterized protein n=1 Tax=Apiospora kogelbergensis TaxID=1337665 RepID=A0AAW0R4E5_9PEZI